MMKTIGMSIFVVLLALIAVLAFLGWRGGGLDVLPINMSFC